MMWGSGVRGRAKANLHALARRCSGSRVIAVSESARREYTDHAVVRADQVVTIHNGIEVIPQPGAGVAVRRQLGFRDDDLVVGMVSALRPEKEHDIAIAAVERLCARYPRLRLLIVGSGPWSREVERLAAAAGETVVLAGARYDVMNVLDAVDVCLHPSRADAFPTTVIEAMAASVPVLATAVGGIAEIVLDGRTGVLVPAPPRPESVADALASLIEDPIRRRELASGGRRRYEQEFTSGPWVRRVRALYDSIVEEGR
jgi:glycosyltransferase involved in cell wall biosynthesis